MKLNIPPILILVKLYLIVEFILNVLNVLNVLKFIKCIKLYFINRFRIDELVE